MDFLRYYDTSTNPLNNNEWSFPLLEIIHIIGFAFSIGTVVLVDLRLLGLAFMSKAPSQIQREMAPWTLGGLIVMLTSGPLIFSSDPWMYYTNTSFRFKIWALLAAIVYNYTVHRSVAKSNAEGAGSKVVGLLSILLWVSVVFGGLFIAFL